MDKLTCIDGAHTLDPHEVATLLGAIPEDGVGAYTYTYGSYEGNGCFVIRVGDKLHVTDMSHCSCYGPTYDISLPDKRALRELEEVKSSPAYADQYDDRTRRVVDFLFPIEGEHD